MTRKQKLELTWVGKDERPRLEPRILLEDPSLSYHAAKRVTDQDRFDNILIQGDNLLALKALEQEFAGKVKCIFIDPPYNTGSAFEHYDDGMEHSLWLSMFRDRVEMLSRFLTPDGSIWITLDDNEAHYARVVLDEVYGRSNFLADVCWEKADSPRMDAAFFSTRHDHLLVYAKERDQCVLDRSVLSSSEAAGHYDKVDEQGRPYYLKPLRAMGGDDARADRPTLFFPLVSPDGTEVLPIRRDGSEGRWRWGAERCARDRSLIEWISSRGGWTPYYRVVHSKDKTRPPETIWRHEDVGSNRTAKAEIQALFGNDNAFDTPKPESLIRRIVSLATSGSDIVLDSFLGSGTTAAVSHKLGRRWIGIEMGDHAVTHCQPRLKKVIDGQDPGGISESVRWRGGGGFRFYRLAPSLMQTDAWGNWVVNKQYNAGMLAEAVCKLEGFRYAPNGEVFWQHGHSTERDFIYVTTQTLNTTQLEWLSDQVGQERSLLILASAFLASGSAWPNLTLKKLPNAVLGRCEFGKDDYSLQVAALPEPETPAAEAAEPGAGAAPPRATARRGRKRTADPAQESLLDAESDE